MSVRNKPNYGIYPINLTLAGSMDMPIVGTRIAMVTALSGATFTSVAGVSILAGGTVAPNTIVNVQVGRALGDPVPFSVNTKISVDEAFEFVRFSWAAQNGVTAFMLVDDDRAGAGVFVDAPSPILGGSIAIQQGGNTAMVTSGGALLTEQQDREGASFWDLAPGVAGVTQIFAPASNVNGAIIRYARIAIAANALELYADTAAPTSVSDATKRIILGDDAPNTQVQLAFPTRLAPGVGLWSAAGGVGPRTTGTYDLL